MINCNECKNATILWLSTEDPRTYKSSGYVLCRLRHPARGLKVLSANKYSCNSFVNKLEIEVQNEPVCKDASNCGTYVLGICAGDKENCRYGVKDGEQNEAE